MSDNVEETLGWEAEQRPRAGLAAIAGGVLLLGGNALFELAGRDIPAAGFVDSLRGASEGRPLTQKAEQVLYLHDNVAGFLVAGVISAIALILLGLTLAYLARATLARQPTTSPILRYIALAGPVTAAVGTLMGAVARAVSANDFAGGDDRTADAARDALTAPAVTAGDVLLVVGTLIMVLALVLVSLNAMRVGLLTRFLGVLGIIVGAVWIFGIDQLGLVRGLWLVFLGFLILGRTPGGIPAAWQTGRAEPWPSQQQIREQREAAKAPAQAAEAPAPAAAPRQSQRQKRKRRK